MNRILTRRLLAASALAFAAFGAGAAAPARADDAPVAVSNSWARPTAGAGTTGAAYVRLTAHGSADALVGASTPVAGMAMVHETINDNGVMKMREVAQVALPAGSAVEFKPGGYHIMLMQLKAPLQAGQSFPLTLRFAHAAPVTVQVSVGSSAGGAMPMHEMGSMGGSMGDMAGHHMQ